jgi:hypothetical protein
MANILTRDEVKEFLELSASDDDRIDTLLPIVDQMLQNFTRRNILQITNTDELHNGDRTPFLDTDDGPIISVTSLKVINPQGGATVQDLVEDQDFKLYEEYVQMIGSQKTQLFDPRWGISFPIGENNVQITYVSGYVTIPSDIKMAAFITMDFLFHSMTPGVVSEKIGNYSYKLANPSDTKENSGLPNNAADLIRAKFRPQIARSAQTFGEQPALPARLSRW